MFIDLWISRGGRKCGEWKLEVTDCEGIHVFVHTPTRQQEYEVSE